MLARTKRLRDPSNKRRRNRYMFVMICYSALIGAYVTQTKLNSHIAHTKAVASRGGGGGMHNERAASWLLEHDCLSPLPKPILGTHDLSRILNMGMPKCGSSSLREIFRSSSSNRTVSHWKCSKRTSSHLGYCGQCMHKAFHKDNNTEILKSCGNHQVFTQMDYESGEDDPKCVFPQLDFMERLYQDSPNATWILPFRNTTDWLRSVTNWDGMADRFDRYCGWPEFKISNENREEDVARFVCNHVRNVRQFVKAHPTLSLVEFDIYDSNAGNFLADMFPILNASHWGKANASPNTKKVVHTKHRSFVNSTDSSSTGR